MPGGGDADFNWFNGDEEALARFCGSPASQEADAALLQAIATDEPLPLEPSDASEVPGSLPVAGAGVAEPGGGA